MTAKDTRAHARFEYGQRLQLRARLRLVSGVTRNLAAGGLCLESRIALEPGEFVRIYLPLRREEREGSRFCAVDGRVAWSREGCYGITFIDVPGNTAQQVADYLETLPLARRERLRCV